MTLLSKRVNVRSLFVSTSLKVLILHLILFCCVNSTHAEVYNWRMHSFVPEAVSLYQGYMLPFIQEVEKRTNGRIKITPYPLNAIVAPTELLVSTAENVIQCAMASPSADTGIIPEAYSLINLPYSWESSEQAHEFWTTNSVAWDIVDKAYEAKNVKLAALLTPSDPQTFMTMFPVNGLSDFKGHRISSVGYWAMLVKNTGASPVIFRSMGEVYQSLEKGVIDGVFMATSPLSDFKWNEVVEYALWPPFATGGTVDIIVNLDAFNSLTPDLQKIFIDTAREMNATHMIPYTRRISTKTIENAKLKGVEFIALSESEKEKFREASIGMWDFVENINGNTAFQMEQIKNYLDAKGIDYPLN